MKKQHNCSIDDSIALSLLEGSQKHFTGKPMGIKQDSICAVVRYESRLKHQDSKSINKAIATLDDTLVSQVPHFMQPTQQTIVHDVMHANDRVSSKWRHMQQQRELREKGIHYRKSRMGVIRLVKNVVNNQNR
jgi:hypothetical protein